MKNNSIFKMVIIILFIIILALVYENLKIMKQPILKKKQNNNKKRYIAVEEPLHNYFNMSSRGGPTKFKQIGILSANNKVVLPLYGKQRYLGSHMWLYYTNAMRGHMYLNLPIMNKDRDCMDEYGCDELYDGDIVTIPVYGNQNFKVHIHDYLHRPIYDPFFI